VGIDGLDLAGHDIKLVRDDDTILGRPEKKIIPRWHGYHGSGLMTGSLTGFGLFHKKVGLPSEQVLHTGAPGYYRCADLAMSEARITARCAAERDAVVKYSPASAALDQRLPVDLAGAGLRQVVDVLDEAGILER
jgi:L-2,4-diaminobutyrate transaminase